MIAEQDGLDNPRMIDIPNSTFLYETAWSPDSKLIAYSKRLESQYHAIKVYSLEENETYQIITSDCPTYRVCFYADFLKSSI